MSSAAGESGPAPQGDERLDIVVNEAPQEQISASEPDVAEDGVPAQQEEAEAEGESAGAEPGEKKLSKRQQRKLAKDKKWQACYVHPPPPHTHTPGLMQ